MAQNSKDISNNDLLASNASPLTGFILDYAYICLTSVTILQLGKCCSVNRGNEHMG